MHALFDKKRKAEIKEGLKKGKIPPRVRPRLPKPAAAALARTKEEQEGADERLLWAAWHGNLGRVKEALAEGADVNAGGIAGVEPEHIKARTALLWACRSSNRDIAELLISEGANVNATQSDGKTSLMWASGNGNIDIVKLLLSKGADIHAVDNNGMSALLYARKNGMNYDVVELLRRHGAIG